MKKSFTLIELIVVIAIIAILAAIIAPNAFKAIEKAKVSEAIADFKTFKTATYAFYADTGDWPVGWNRDGWFYCMEDNGFLTDINSWPGWDGPYLERIKSAHPWAGVYCLEYLQYGQGTALELIIEYNRCCYPSHVQQNQACASDDCFVPRKSAQKIDETVDDGNLTLNSGNFFYQWDNPEGRADVTWVLVWDAL